MRHLPHACRAVDMPQPGPEHGEIGDATGTPSERASSSHESRTAVAASRRSQERSSRSDKQIGHAASAQMAEPIRDDRYEHTDPVAGARGAVFGRQSLEDGGQHHAEDRRSVCRHQSDLGVSDAQKMRETDVESSSLSLVLHIASVSRRPSCSTSR